MNYMQFCVENPNVNSDLEAILSIIQFLINLNAAFTALLHAPLFTFLLFTFCILDPDWSILFHEPMRKH